MLTRVGFDDPVSGARTGDSDNRVRARIIMYELKPTHVGLRPFPPVAPRNLKVDNVSYKPRIFR